MDQMVFGLGLREQSKCLFSWENKKTVNILIIVEKCPGGRVVSATDI